MKQYVTQIISSVLLFFCPGMLCYAQSTFGNVAESQKDSVFNFAMNYCFGNSSVSEYDCYINKQTTSNKWLVFVDMMPDANWEHPCKYIYVETNGNSYSACTVDSCLPPHDINLEAVALSQTTMLRTSKVPSYQVGGTISGNGNSYSVSVLPGKSNNSFSSKTYAVILSGGSTPELNASRYWNDCSFIYKTLRQTYGIPKNNIKVLMSDGKSSIADQNVGLSFFPNLRNSSCDLDGDGIGDVDYSATKDTLVMVLSELKSKLTDDDHLLVFVTDHGGKDNTNGESYINLWNRERIYPTEFANCFNGFNAGYISFVLGQCYSGGFIPALKADNHIVMTACGEDEESFRCSSTDKDYNEFLYNWTSYINGSDTYGNTVLSNTEMLDDINEKTLKKAYEYAVEKDYYNKGKTLSRIENPQISILANSTAETLALDTIPPTVDLCITDYNRDIPSSDMFIFASPYIWIRNQNDGKQIQETENPIVNEEHPYIYIYTKVSNRGVKPYDGNGQSIGYCWTKSSLVITMDMWKGFMNDGYGKANDDGIYGNIISTQTIKDVINPGDTIVSERKYYFGGDDYFEAIKKEFEMCILAYLTKLTNRCDVPITDEGYADLTRSHRVAQNNIIVKGGNEQLNTDKPVMLFNQNDYASSYSIRLKQNESSRKILSKAEVNLKLPSTLVSSFEKTQQQADSVLMDANTSGKMRLLGANSIIRNVTMEPKEVVPVYLTCNFNADTDNFTSETYDLDFVVVDNRTGEEIGGQRFRIKENERPAIDATLDKTLVSVGQVSLSVAECSEDAEYEWFDKNGKLIGTGSSVTVSSGADASEYTVRIISKSDGAVIYRKSEVGGTSYIDTVHPSVDYVDVVLKEKTDDALSLQLTSADSAKPVQSCGIEPGSKSCTMRVQNFVDGVYQISLLKDGKVLDTKKFKK